ncbi:MAG: hypothetical protein HYZ53_12785 [Planctomycetes bacterium]|nr:hypothetical protein [Planctomycetota bacterium]
MALVDARSRRQLEALGKLLQDPESLRLCVYALGLGIGLLGVYYPLHGQVAALKGELEVVRGRANLVEETDALKQQVALFEKRLVSTRDSNEWVQYVLTGTRACNLKFRNYDPSGSTLIGPYEVLRFVFEVEGAYESLIEFLLWLERNDRLLRIESMLFERTDRESVKLKAVILGMGELRGPKPGTARAPREEKAHDAR